MPTEPSRIEIELRSLFGQPEYERLKTFLDKNAHDLGEDDKNVFAFLLPDRIVKAVNNISKGSTYIVIKLNRLGSGRSDFEEIEIPIASADFDKVVKLFSSLPFDQMQNFFQKRHNYEYKGVDLALKYSDSWGYHMELEILIRDPAKQRNAEEKIRTVAGELGVRIMSEQEITEFAKRIDEWYKQCSYKQ